MVARAKWIPGAGMARRWVRFEMPVMVCIEVDEQFEDAHVLMVVAGAEAEDISLAILGHRHRLSRDRITRAKRVPSTRHRPAPHAQRRGLCRNLGSGAISVKCLS